MTYYIVGTGLAETDGREFDSREEAWNTLAKELTEGYGLHKSGPRASIVGRLRERQEVPMMESHNRDGDCHDWVDVKAGFITKDWDGNYFFEGPSTSSFPYENHEERDSQ